MALLIFMLALSGHVAASQENTPEDGTSFGSWETGFTKDILDDSLSYYFASQFQEEWIVTFHCKTGDCELTMYAKNKDVFSDLVIASRESLSNLTLFKIDNLPIIENQGFFLSAVASGESLNRIAEHMRPGNRMKIRAIHKGSSYTVSVDLRGFREAMDWALLRHGLEWDLEEQEIQGLKKIRELGEAAARESERDRMLYMSQDTLNGVTK